MPSGSVSWLVDHCNPPAFPRLPPQWPLGDGSPLTVARQRRIRTGFPSSVSYSVVRTIMRGLLVALGDARLVEGRHLVEGADGGLEQRQGKHRARALAQPEVEVEQRRQAEAPQHGAMSELLRAVPGDHVARDCRNDARDHERGCPGDE